MGLVYHNGKFVPEDRIQKTDVSSRALLLLRSFLDKNEPGLVRFLVHTWNAQGKAITYKELREAILAGDIDPQWVDDWMQDYTRFVANHMQPAWDKAIAAAVVELERKLPMWKFDPMGDAVRAWTATHSAAFIANVTTTQVEGLRAVVRRAAVLEDMSVDALARAVRPMVGLTKQQAEANMRYFENLLDNGVSQKKAQDLSLRYSARQHRQRGYTIARTELATAYNAGAYEGTKQAQAAGYLGKTVKVWCTADDERVCSICGSLEGKEASMDASFDGASRSWSTHLTAPAHPGCRCAIIYREVEPPMPNSATEQLKIQNIVV